MRTEDIGTEVFFLPAAAHTEKDGSFTNTQRMVQWHEQAVEPRVTTRSDLWFAFHLGRVIREKLAGSTEARRPAAARPDLGLPDRGAPRRADAEAVLGEINGCDGEGKPLGRLHQAQGRRSRRPAAAGSTAASTPTASTRQRGASRAASRAGSPPSGGGRGRRTAASSTTARRPTPTAGRGASARPTSGGTRSRASGPATTCPTSRRRSGRTTAAGGRGPPRRALRGDEPFIMQNDGKAWLYVPSGLSDGPLPAHYEPHESPVTNPLYRQQSNPDAAGVTRARTTRTTRPVAPPAATSSRTCSPPTGSPSITRPAA